MDWSLSWFFVAGKIRQRTFQLAAWPLGSKLKWKTQYQWSHWLISARNLFHGVHLRKWVTGICLQTTEHGCLPTSGYLLCNNPHEWPCCAAILGALLSVWPYSATFYGYTSPSRRPKWTSLGVPLHFFVLLLSQPPSSYFYSLLSTEIHVNINEVSPSH